MRLSVLIACCAACGFTNGVAPGADAGEVTGDGPDAPGDRDGDGILDVVDLCPDVADPLQLDHDGDGHGDACDRCPHRASVTDPDEDQDGVGDACDPRPAIAGEQRVLWLGFYDSDAAAIASWSAVGSWELGGGWMQSTRTTSLDTLRAPLTVQRAYVESALRLDNYSDGSAAAGVISGMVYAGSNLIQFYQCALFKSGSQIGARTAANDAVISDQYAAWSGALANGTIVEVVSQFGAAFDCNYSAPATDVQSTLAVTAGGFELVVQRANVSFDYLFVVDSPP